MEVEFCLFILLIGTLFFGTLTMYAFIKCVINNRCTEVGRYGNNE